MFKKDDIVSHQGREAVVIETNYLGVKLSYLDDDTFVFVKAQMFDEIEMSLDPIAVKPVEAKMLPLPKLDWDPRHRSIQTRVLQSDANNRAKTNIHSKHSNKEWRKQNSAVGGKVAQAKAKKERDELAAYVANKLQQKEGA